MKDELQQARLHKSIQIDLKRFRKQKETTTKQDNVVQIDPRGDSNCFTHSFVCNEICVCDRHFIIHKLQTQLPDQSTKLIFYRKRKQF